MSKELHWYKVIDNPLLLNFNTNNMCVIEVNGKKITIAKGKDNQLFAFAHKCPHAGGIMADGFMNEKGCVVCPLHRYQFDCKTGRNTSGEGYYLKTYPLETKPDGLYVGMAASGIFGFF